MNLLFDQGDVLKKTPSKKGACPLYLKDCIDFKYSSAYSRVKNEGNPLLDDVPIILPTNWHSYINESEKQIDLDHIRNSIERQVPLGDENWQYMICKRYGLESTLRPRGRPKKDTL